MSHRQGCAMALLRCKHTQKTEQTDDRNQSDGDHSLQFGRTEVLMHDLRTYPHATADAATDTIKPITPQDTNMATTPIRPLGLLAWKLDIGHSANSPASLAASIAEPTNRSSRETYFHAWLNTFWCFCCNEYNVRVKISMNSPRGASVNPDTTAGDTCFDVALVQLWAAEAAQ